MCSFRLSVLVVIAACGSTPPPKKPPPVGIADTHGTHADGVRSVIQPLIDADVATAIVVGLYDAGKTEVYGFGKGPEGKPPTGTTLFEIGSLTKIYTSLLLADSIQRREVALDTHVSDLLPPGVTMPTADGKVITLGQLALHTSGLPAAPPTVVARGNVADPYAGYTEDLLYNDLVRTPLATVPGQRVRYSNYGVGLLGFALGRKLGSSLADAMRLRILEPLALESTYFVVPKVAQPRRIVGTNVDLSPVAPWSWGVLAGAGALVSSARDQLALVDAELDAAAGSKLPLRAAMRLTQEAQLERDSGDNEGLGWQIDSAGRYWHNGGTGGHRAFLGFDPKTRRGIVVLAATGTSLVDHVAEDLYRVLAGEKVVPPPYPTGDKVKDCAGTYQLGDFKLSVSITGKRVYITGQGEKPLRLIPLTDSEMWFEAQQSGVVFEKEHDKIVRAVFVFGTNHLAAPRVDTPQPPPDAGSGAGSGTGSGSR